MRPIPKIEGANITKYNLALYVSFHQAILACIDSIAVPSKVFLTEELKEQYAQLVDKLTDKNSDQRARIGTAEQADDDAERDRLVSQLFFVVQNGLRSTKETVRKAAELLEIVIRPYKNVQKQGYSAETASIRGLIQDLEKDDNQEAVSTLNLQSVINELQTANETFDTKWKSGVDEAAAKSRQVTTVELRAQTDDLYNELCERIYASGFAATEADEVSLITSIINEINGIIANFKASYNMSAAKKKSKTKSTEDTESQTETAE